MDIEFQKFLDMTLGEVIFDDNSLKEAKDESVEQAFAEQLITCRRSLGLSQSELSRLTGIQQASISKIERAICNPSLQTLERIANAMGKKIIIRLV